MEDMSYGESQGLFLATRGTSRADVLVELFDAFTPDNDPHQEHDFGSFDHHGETIFWKIDYYDLNLALASPEPADPAVTRRVLTLMRAEEY